MNAAGLQALADNRLEKYHSCRPREAPGGLTPAEFSAPRCAAPLDTFLFRA